MANQMTKFESSRRPEIKARDLERLTRILSVFNLVTFNYHGEMVALMDVDIPIIGTVTVSLYEQESHIKVYRDTIDMWTGYLKDLVPGYHPDLLTRDSLAFHVKRVVRERLIQELNNEDGATT